MAARVISEGRKEKIQEDTAVTVHHFAEKCHSSVAHMVGFGLGFGFKKAFHFPKSSVNPYQ